MELTMGIERNEEIFRVEVEQPDGRGQEYIVRAPDTWTAIARFMAKMVFQMGNTSAVRIITFADDMLLGNAPVYFGLVDGQQYSIQRIELDLWVAKWE